MKPIHWNSVGVVVTLLWTACQGTVLHTQNSAGASVDVKLDSSFPGVVLTPPSSARDFCSYSLTGIYESNARQAFFDPRVDADLADTRIAFADVAWSLERRGPAALAVVGVPRPASSPKGKGNSTVGDDDDDDKPVRRFSSIELLFTLKSNASADARDARGWPVVWKTDSSETASAAAAAQARAVLGVEVRVDDYVWASGDGGAVLVLEWELMAGTPLAADRADALTRSRRRVTAGDCVYDAGDADAADDAGNGVRCEVRFSRSVGGARFVSLYQSYAHFGGSLVHRGAQMVAAPGTQAPAGTASAASTPPPPAPLALALAAVGVLAVALARLSA